VLNAIIAVLRKGVWGALLLCIGRWLRPWILVMERTRRRLFGSPAEAPDQGTQESSSTGSGSVQVSSPYSY